MLERIAEQHIPLFAIHGDRDLAVPMATARSAARRGRGELVVVHGGSHSWLLKDPESLPAIIHRLMQGRLGTAVLKAILDAGIDPNDATDDEIESAFYRPTHWRCGSRRRGIVPRRSRNCTAAPGTASPSRWTDRLLPWRMLGGNGRHSARFSPEFEAGVLR